MKDIHNVIGYYDEAKRYFELKDYVKAAELYRKSYLTYETGELPIYIEECKEKGNDAYLKYHMILNDYLSKEDKERFIKEDEEYGDWDQLFGC